MANKDRYEISYTLKGKPGFGKESFTTKEEAEIWLKSHENDIYWHQLTEINPESKHPKPIFDAEGEVPHWFEEKNGVLKTYFETGMECLGLILYEDGIHGEENPNYDPSKPEDSSNFKYFASYDAVHFLASGQILQIEDGPKIILIKDRDFASRDGYRLSFYPHGFSRLELLKLFGKETVRAKLWKKGSK